MLEQGVDEGYRGYRELRLGVPFRDYQELPRFKTLLARVDEDVAAQRQRAIDNGWLIEPPQEAPGDRP